MNNTSAAPQNSGGIIATENGTEEQTAARVIAATPNVRWRREGATLALRQALPVVEASDQHSSSASSGCWRMFLLAQYHRRFLRGGEQENCAGGGATGSGSCSCCAAPVCCPGHQHEHSSRARQARAAPAPARPGGTQLLIWRKRMPPHAFPENSDPR
eukprot:COSAG05_NODE_894_length_6706_cov_13.114424_6_plen_158_part_00